MSDKITVLNIDSHPLWCSGVASVINGQPDMRLVAQTSTGRQAIDYFPKHQTNIILMDIRLPDISGIESMARSTQSFRIHVSSSSLVLSKTHGTQAYLLKSMPSSGLVEVIRQVHSGKRNIPASIATQLTEHFTDDLFWDREVEVLSVE